MRLAVLSLALSSLVLVGAPSAAAEEDGDLWTMDLDELLDVKVKVATKQAETVADAPSSVTVFTRTEIQNMGVTSLEELLNFVPGFSTARTEFIGTQWALSTRGFWGVSDPAVLLLVDGQRVNEHFSGSFGLLDRLISLGLAERVEVIRGPGSALYGSNAFYGVINVVTVKEANEVTLAAGELQSGDVSVNLAQEMGGNRVVAFLRGFFDDGETYRDIYDPWGLTDETQDPREGRDAFLSFSRGGFRIHARHQSRDFEDFYLLGQVANDITRFHEAGTGIHASYRFDLPERWAAEVAATYNVYESEGFARMAPQGQGPFEDGDLILGVLHQTRVANVSADASTKLGEHHTLSYGFIYEYADNPRAYQASNYDIFDYTYLGSIVVQREKEKRFLADEERTIAGLYLQEQFRLPRLTAIAGLRWDHYNDFGNTVNPRGALIFDAGRGATLKLMYGEAFVAPSMEKLYLRNNPFEQANPNLEAQEIRTVELAWVQQIATLESTVTLFDNHETGIFELTENAEGAFQTVNIGRNDSRGVELAVAANVGERFFLRATYSRVLDGERPEAARDLASIIGNLNLGRYNFNLNGYYRGTSEALPEQGSYVVVGATARCQLHGGVGIFATVSNALDEDYLTYTRNGDRGLPNRGRQLLLGVRYSF